MSADFIGAHVSDHDDVIRRLEGLSEDLKDARAEAAAAHEEARGAHSQARKTNGRTDELERITGKLAGDMNTVRRTIFGSEQDGLQSDGGLVGWVRQTRRDIRVAGGLIGVVAPSVWWVLDNLSGWLG